MFPSFTMDDVPDRSPAYIKYRGYLVLGHSMAMEVSYFKDLFLGKLSAIYFRSLIISISPLSNFVSNVVKRSSYKNMIGITAYRVITFVTGQHVVRYLTESDLIAMPMSRDSLSIHLKLNVPTRFRWIFPRPASVNATALVNSLPKSSIGIWLSSLSNESSIKLGLIMVNTKSKSVIRFLTVYFRTFFHQLDSNTGWQILQGDKI